MQRWVRGESKKRRVESGFERAQRKSFRSKAYHGYLREKQQKQTQPRLSFPHVREGGISSSLQTHSRLQHTRISDPRLRYLVRRQFLLTTLPLAHCLA